MKNCISPTGKVHRILPDPYFRKDGKVSILCNHAKGRGDAWHPIQYYHPWPKTDKIVTCRRCIKEINDKLLPKKDKYAIAVDEQHMKAEWIMGSPNLKI